MSEEFFGLLVTLAGALIVYLGALGGVEAFTQWAKGYFNLSGVGVKVFAGIIAIIATVITGLASGELTQAMLQDAPQFIEWLLPAMGVVSPLTLEWLHKGRKSSK